MLSTMLHDDPICFNKRTATLLRGLRAAELIPEFKKRNISSEMLHGLDELDWIKLGATPDKVEEICNLLKLSRKNPGKGKVDIKNRMVDYASLINQGKRHLSLVQAYVSYTRLRLTNKGRINYFVSSDKCLSSSNVLIVSVKAIFNDIEDLESEICQLETLICGVTNNPKRFCYIYAIVGGMGLASIILLRSYLFR